MRQKGGMENAQNLSQKKRAKKTKQNGGPTAAVPNEPPALWTYLGDDCFVPHLVWPVAARHEETAAPAFHHAPRHHTKEEKFTRAGETLALVTYKEFVAGLGSSSPGAQAMAGRPREEEALVAVPGLGPVQKVVFAHCAGYRATKIGQESKVLVFFKLAKVSY